MKMLGEKLQPPSSFSSTIPARVDALYMMMFCGLMYVTSFKLHHPSNILFLEISLNCLEPISNGLEFDYANV